jgi:DNA-binding transcriptional LysR family regulator
MRYPHIVRTNLNLLASFQALVEERSVTRAAARMFLSQPAMSRVLDKLQEIFDDKLLVRTRKGFEPTRRALYIYEQLEHVLPAVEDLLRGHKFNPADATDYFRIAMTDHVALALLPTLMKAFAEKAPGVRIEISAWDDSSFRRLDTNALDLVIWVNEAPSPLRSEQIYEDKSVCIVRKGHPIASSNLPLTVERYLQLEHLVISLVGTYQGDLDRALAQLGYRRNARLTLPFFAAAIPIIESTDMAATLPTRMAKSFPHSRTCCLPIPINLPQIRYIQVWHPRNDEEPGHLWLRQLIKETSLES